jgi:tetraacyldisaccharide 4'-kinase
LESVVSGERLGFFSAILKLKLLQISWICLGMVKLRRWFYSKGVLCAKHLPCKVISVGNVVVGGSGKTPAVVAIARMLKECMDPGLAVLSRGYHSTSRGPAVVSDGGNVLLNAAEAGEEPYLLSRSLPGVPVLIGKDRVQTGLMAIREWNCRAIILDDGFQYLRLARDIDIVTIDATRPFGFGHILPRGYLREPLSTLNYADLILLTRVDQCKCLDFVRDRLADVAPSVPVFESIYEPCSLRSLHTDQEVGLDTIGSRNVLAVCGIANPSSFVETLRSLEPARVALLSFPDHHAYPLSSIEMIRRRSAEQDVEIIVTTEKDAPKLSAIEDHVRARYPVPVLILTVELKVVGCTAGRFAELVQELCGLTSKE